MLGGWHAGVAPAEENALSGETPGCPEAGCLRDIHRSFYCTRVNSSLEPPSSWSTNWSLETLTT